MQAERDRSLAQAREPSERWAEAVLERLGLSGSERVLELGCGSGALTERLRDRLPAGHVVAAEGSAVMAREARARLAGSGSRVEVVIADPLSPLPADPPFDAVVSVATFDRVPDHEALFANIAAALRPGGRLVAECGGAGDLERLEGALLGLGEPPEQRTRATPDATVCRLQAAGFRDCAAWLTPDPVRFERAEQLWTYLEHGLLRRRLEQMHFSQRWRFLRRVVERLDDLQVDFVRLSICAWKREGLSPGEDGCRW